jgi:hypothetical protein
MSAPDDLAGRSFGAWTVLAIDAVGKRAACRCKCGAVRQVAITALENGECASCGCSPLPREQRRELRDEAEARPRRIERDWRPGR